MIPTLEDPVATIKITESIRAKMQAYLTKHRRPELVNTFLYYLECSYNIEPVVFPPGKTIYQSVEQALDYLDKEGKIWREAEIKIGFGNQSVNELTKKIYICPFTGKVFGDNTHPNPQDAIYDWVSNCKENTERSGGLRVKRFFVSEDPEVIKSYIPKTQQRQQKTKVVYSSVMSGKLYHSKEEVIRSFKKSYLKRLTLVEVQNQNRFEIEDHFLAFLQGHLQEDKITAFVEAMAEFDAFLPAVNYWIESSEKEAEGDAVEE
jgi:hypothetical protein